MEILCYWRKLRSEPRLTLSGRLDNALPSWISPIPQRWVCLVWRDSVFNLHFTANDALSQLNYLATFSSVA